MPGLTLWKNQEIHKLKREMDRLFNRLLDDFGMHLFPRITKGFPFINISETEDEVIVHAEIPGVDPNDLDISITENKLTIRGEMRQEYIKKNGKYSRAESSYRFFSRMITLPNGVMIEDAKATCKDGILTIVMPKSKPETAREVKIKIN